MKARTPKVNKESGRDHWRSYPEGDGFTPEDVITTIYTTLSIDVRKEYRDHLDRPWRIATGEPIRELLL